MSQTFEINMDWEIYHGLISYGYRTWIDVESYENIPYDDAVRAFLETESKNTEEFYRIYTRVYRFVFDSAARFTEFCIEYSDFICSKECEWHVSPIGNRVDANGRTSVLNLREMETPQ